MKTALHDRLAASGAHMGEYCGAETALSFGHVRGEFEALRRACGIYDLSWRAKFKISGKDRVRWLNGMISNNVRDLPAGRGNYSFVLNPQGHIQGDLYVYNRDDHFVAGTERQQLEKLMQLLQRYIIMDQVELADLSGEAAGIAVQGPQSREVLERAGFDVAAVEPMQLVDLTWRNLPVSATRMADDKFLTYELWMHPEHAPAVWDALLAAGAKPVGMNAVEMFRVAAGIPRYGQDIRERELPQETGQQQALSFTKGCYIGQEIVERIRSRGNVHRTLAGLVIKGAPPAPGTKIMADGKEVGEITSALAVPATDGNERVLALGYVRREASKPGTAVQVGDSDAVVAELPSAEVT